MIYSGVDIVEIERIARAVERWGDRFLVRVFTTAELRRCQGDVGLRMPSLAARWAAKEAAAKLLGVGVRGLGGGSGALGWHELEVTSDERGRPLLLLHAAAAERAAVLGLGAIGLSLSHTRTLAVAMVVAQGA